MNKIQEYWVQFFTNANAPHGPWTTLFFYNEKDAKDALKMLTVQPQIKEVWMKKKPSPQELGKLGGKVKSEKKAASSKANGKKGGRPKKVKSK